MPEHISPATLRAMKQRGEKIACLTAYDAAFAAVLDANGVEVVLVGDSLGTVLHGSDSTLQVGLGDVIYHSRMVRRATRRAMLLTDLPFMSRSTPERALGSAERLVAEGGSDMVKLEGGEEYADTVGMLSRHGIPVCAHLGLLPQSALREGYRVQGRAADDAGRLQQAAVVLQQAGALLLVLECVPSRLAADITSALTIPVIGIGAGPHCDGQVLVLYDILGIGQPSPSFTHDFLGERTGGVHAAVTAYVQQVKAGTFPGSTHSFE